MNLVRTEYAIENNKPVIFIYTRDDDTRNLTKIDSFVPYFYVPEGERDNVKGLKQDSKVYYSAYGDRLTKIYTALPSDVRDLRDRYTKSFEADVLFPIRYMVDKVDKIDSVQSKVMYLDIETNNSGRIPDVTVAPEDVVCVSFYCSGVYYTYVWRDNLSPGVRHDIFGDVLHETHYCKNENSMFYELIAGIKEQDPDVITGWNSSRFDLPYLINRMKRNGINYNNLSPMGAVQIREDYEIAKGMGVVIKGIATLDLYDAYRKMTVQKDGQEESYKLDYIGKKVAGIGKNESSHNIHWMWQNELDRLIAYNVNDCQILVKIDEKMQLVDFFEEMRRMCFCNLEDTLTIGRMMDSYILKMFHDKIVFPTKIKHEEYEFEGAFVNSWGNGIYKNVAVFDLKSLYPSAIYSLNLSPETISDKPIPDSIHVDKVYVKKEPKGFLPQVIDTLFKERAKYKKLLRAETYDSVMYRVYDRRQYAVKTILNGLYGQTAYIKSRIYDARIAETTTWVGRNIIEWSRDFINNLDYQVLYADTDSVHWVIGDEVDIEQALLVQQALNESYTDFAKRLGLDNHIFNIEFEKVYRRAFYGKAKKRYAGAICYKDGKPLDKLETFGLETRRSDASQFTKKILSAVLDMLLMQDKSKEDVIDYIKSEVDRIRKGDCKYTEIGIPKGISKELCEYGVNITTDSRGVVHHAGIPANIRGAIFATKVLGIEISNKPKMVYITKMSPDYPATYKFSFMPDAEEKPVDSLCFDEDEQIPPGTVIDIDKMLEKTVRDKLEPIFNALTWDLEDIVPSTKKRRGKQTPDATIALDFNSSASPSINPKSQPVKNKILPLKTEEVTQKVDNPKTDSDLFNTKWNRSGSGKSTYQGDGTFTQKSNVSPTAKANDALLGKDLFGNTVTPDVKGALKQKFVIPPFSVLSSRDGDWLKRKREWLSLGIQSELGRDEGILYGNDEVMKHAQLNYYREHEKTKKFGRTFSLDMMRGEGADKYSYIKRTGEVNPYTMNKEDKKWQKSHNSLANLTERVKTGETVTETTLRIAKVGTGTSIFDPVLCELMYSWFCPPGGQIIDVFAGGSVRGIVASIMGYKYWGSELRQIQVDANYEQAINICSDDIPEWVCGDSLKTSPDAPMSDFWFTCPPYGNLEVYSDDPNDLSNMDYSQFMNVLGQIFDLSCDRLKDNRYACVVVGDFRDKKGFMHNFVSDTISCFLKIGMKLYNEIIFVTPAGSLPIRVQNQFNSGRKIGKTHQNVLVFIKGDPKKVFA